MPPSVERPSSQACADRNWPDAVAMTLKQEQSKGKGGLAERPPRCSPPHRSAAQACVPAGTASSSPWRMAGGGGCTRSASAYLIGDRLGSGGAHLAALFGVTLARCPRCNQFIKPNEAWDLGHTDDRGSWTGPEHASCNRAAGARARHTCFFRSTPPDPSPSISRNLPRNRMVTAIPDHASRSVGSQTKRHAACAAVVKSRACGPSSSVTAAAS
jgi:hypothetical protein